MFIPVVHLLWLFQYAQSMAIIIALFTLKYHNAKTVAYTTHTHIEQKNSHAGEDSARRA